MSDSNQRPTPARPAVPPFRGPLSGRPAAGTTPGRGGFRPFVPPRSGDRRFAPQPAASDESQVARKAASAPSARASAPPPARASAPAQHAEPSWLAEPTDDHGEPGVAPEAVEAANAMLASHAIGERAPTVGPSEQQRRQSFAAAIAAVEAFGGAPSRGAGAAQSLADAAQALSAAIASGDLATFGSALTAAASDAVSGSQPSGQGGEVVAAQLEALAERIRSGQLAVKLPTGPVTDPVALVSALAALFDVRA